MGPIVIGTAVGSLGQFFPTDKGLEAVTNGLPWPVQVSLLEHSMPSKPLCLIHLPLLLFLTYCAHTYISLTGRAYDLNLLPPHR